MKRIYLFGLFLQLSIVSSGQITAVQRFCPCPLNALPDRSVSELKLPNDIPAKPVIDYLQKSRSQQKTAWILLGAGAGLMTTAFLYPRGKLIDDGICIGVYCSTKYKNDNLKTVVFITGATSSLTSIPFFILSSKNKNRAASVAMVFKMEKATVLSRGALSTNSFPAAAVHLRLHQ